MTLFLSPASGDHVCNLELYEVAGAAYVASDQRLFGIGGEGGPFSVWIYVESNGEPGLQRGGTTMLGDFDICQLSENPDQGVL